MEQTTLSKQSVSAGLALVLACLVNSVVVVVKEKNAAVMDGMKKVTGHHWITHSVLVVVLFGLFTWMFGRMNGGRGPQMSAGGLIRTVVSGVVVAGLIIAGFYLFED